MINGVEGELCLVANICVQLIWVECQPVCITNVHIVRDWLG
jgi:hypothetical protein